VRKSVRDPNDTEVGDLELALFAIVPFRVFHGINRVWE
jgi:hypothetical protein